MVGICKLLCCSKLNILLFSLWSSIINCEGSFSIALNGINVKSVDNFVCPPNDVESTKLNCMSEMQCVYSCALKGKCKSIFFHEGDGSCVMCKKSYMDTNGLQSYTGTKYYRPTASTCSEWSSFNGIVNGTFMAEVDPDGFENQFGTITVHCDLDSEPGKAVTVLNHNREARTSVRGYDTCNSYRVTLTYSLGFVVVKDIVDASTACKQYVKYECFHSAVFIDQGIGCVAWETRFQERSAYFTGNGTSSYYCDCEQSGTCSTASGCQCSRNDKAWRLDDGDVTNKEHLPITAFTAGDADGKAEYGYHTIGPLLCW